MDFNPAKSGPSRPRRAAAATVATTGGAAGRPYGWADVPGGAGDVGSLAVGDSADGDGLDPDTAGDGDVLVGDGEGE